MKLTRLFQEFFNSEKAGGLVLIACTLLSLLAANLFPGLGYAEFWSRDISGHTLQHWINDGLMTIFFLLIGLELEREIYAGELSGFRNAALPVFAAAGGMLAPAGLFMAVAHGTPAAAGAGIPMATDIAFAIGILSLLGSRAPASLKVFLTALAVIDDLGAILVIAIFYTSSLVCLNLLVPMAIFFFLLLLNRLKIHILWPYLLGGGLLWFFMLHSGIHATISGVLLAFAIPFGDGSEKSPSYRLQHFLHKPVAYLILPLFALANTGLPLARDWYHGLVEPVSVGIFLGLIVGKPLGIYLFSLAGVKAGLCSLPDDLRWKHIAGTGFLGGIGFTMSIFITLLAFSDEGLIGEAKIAVLLASVVAGIIGYTWLRKALPAS